MIAIKTPATIASGITKSSIIRKTTSWMAQTPVWTLGVSILVSISATASWILVPNLPDVHGSTRKSASAVLLPVSLSRKIVLLLIVQTRLTLCATLVREAGRERLLSVTESHAKSVKELMTLLLKTSSLPLTHLIKP